MLSTLLSKGLAFKLSPSKPDTHCEGTALSSFMSTEVVNYRKRSFEVATHALSKNDERVMVIPISFLTIVYERNMETDIQNIVYSEVCYSEEIAETAHNTIVSKFIENKVNFNELGKLVLT